MGSGDMLPREILKMHTLRDTFSLILGAKSRAFRTDLSGNSYDELECGLFLYFINI